MMSRANYLSADELRGFLDDTGGEVFDLRIKCSILQNMIDDVFVLGDAERSADYVSVKLSTDQFDAVVWLGGAALAAARKIENKIDDLFKVGGHDCR